MILKSNFSFVKNRYNIFLRVLHIEAKFLLRTLKEKTSIQRTMEDAGLSRLALSSS